MAKIFVATTSFVAGSVQVNVGDTVTDGHPLLQGRQALFAPFKPTFTHTVPAEVKPKSVAPSTPAVQRPAPLRSPATTRPKPAT